MNKFVRMLASLVIISVFIQGIYCIVGGVDSDIAEFPYQVSLRRNKIHICGGVILSDWKILTAAHCIAGIVEYPFTELIVVSGSSTLTPGHGDVHHVQNVIVHPAYVPKGPGKRVKNDIAIITLQVPIAENQYQSRIALPSKNTPSGIIGVVSGWGRTHIDEPVSPSSILRKTMVDILSSKDCLEHGERIDVGQICGFSGEGSGTCKGDSGGPLVYNNTVIGIVSTGDRECGQNVPHTYTRVYTHLQFIKALMDQPVGI